MGLSKKCAGHPVEAFSQFLINLYQSAREIPLEAFLREGNQK
jgi:hypothetical protein